MQQYLPLITEICALRCHLFFFLFLIGKKITQKIFFLNDLTEDRVQMLRTSAINRRVGAFHIFLLMMKGKKIIASTATDQVPRNPAVQRALAVCSKYRKLTPEGRAFLEAQARMTTHPNSLKRAKKERIVSTLRRLEGQHTVANTDIVEEINSLKKQLSVAKSVCW